MSLPTLYSALATPLSVLYNAASQRWHNVWDRARIKDFLKQTAHLNLLSEEVDTATQSRFLEHTMRLLNRDDSLTLDKAIVHGLIDVASQTPSPGMRRTALSALLSGLDTNNPKVVVPVKQFGAIYAQRWKELHKLLVDAEKADENQRVLLIKAAATLLTMKRLPRVARHEIFRQSAKCIAGQCTRKIIARFIHGRTSHRGQRLNAAAGRKKKDFEATGC